MKLDVIVENRRKFYLQTSVLKWTRWQMLMFLIKNREMKMRLSLTNLKKRLREGFPISFCVANPAFWGSLPVFKSFKKNKFFYQVKQKSCKFQINSFVYRLTGTNQEFTTQNEMGKPSRNLFSPLGSDHFVILNLSVW
jgi:hypothetical protein